MSGSAIPMESLEHYRSKLEIYGQEQLLTFWDQLEDWQRQMLVEDLDSLNFLQLSEYVQHRQSRDFSDLLEDAVPPVAIRWGRSDLGFSRRQAYERGVAALRGGEIGVILVAGGQGTRLAYDDPKGTFPIGPVSGSTLFRIHIEKLRALSSRYGRSVPLYLMTSPATTRKTEEHFRRNGNYGLPRHDLKIFEQPTMPAIDMDTGRVLLDEKFLVALSPNGHGGLLEALQRHDVLEEAKYRGIRHFFYFQVDNPLVSIADPSFIGAHLLSRSEYTLQVVAKDQPEDRVGNVVRNGGRTHIVEYSDMPSRYASQRNADGHLKFWAGSIAVHTFSLEFLERVLPTSLPYHVSYKKVKHLDLKTGERVNPTEPNAIKFERFIFDILPEATRSIVVEIDPSEGFAPLKNASDPNRPDLADTPEKVREAMVRQHTHWLRGAGVEVAEGTPVEISPLYALDAEELEEKVAPGTSITESTYLR
ncbi:MAG: UTP--glucose-1-phosphate uridylyltransferase [Planctomycetia bacterium]|nr:UTP--glucose-1-phosphate uridylyltransferase [Planctomycetia bacterium]